MASPLGVLCMSYGTARGLDDVERYYTHIRGGRAPSPELLEELKGRYRAIGGRSPLIEITEAQVRGLERELGEAERLTGGQRAFRAYHGMKHQAPYIEDVVRTMADEGIREGIGLVLAPHYARMSVGAYIDRAGKAAADAGISMTFVEQWHDHPDVVRFVMFRVSDAIGRLPEEERSRAPVVFSAHSLPARIVDEGDPYPRQVEESARLVGEELGLPASRVRVAWQSSGRTGEPWLGPDLTEVLRELAVEGHRAAVSCPIGFVADHLEILYDIDIEAQEVARELGITLVRTESPNDDPAFVRALAGVVRRRLEEPGSGGDSQPQR
ncbi:MAG TPA: ferrochelatase [Actinomycetota bacterium]|nr:ferrochelatase [Actinomycetota bacterium]